jgi:hypothetical protein
MYGKLYKLCKKIMGAGTGFELRENIGAMKTKT